ncbi:uncharacterized protein LOC118198374 [Stegodyphus dumicola]|uniref:uncharacterized protein LOC118198374 n=1 Tax=Stegodyphus dumicola TaxID=202533 RepID=UPI0015A77082|nr:uncharacterized protein LOC118198374 [Stegodyphus dumicola]
MCIVCGKKHVPLMCDTLDARNKKSDNSDEKCASSKISMSNITYGPKYGEVLKEWEQEGVIEEVPKEEIKSSCPYMPHRHVVKANSTTKIIPVFNAFSKEKGTPSLNDCVEKGLNLIELIPSILKRFRLYKFGITDNTCKALLQINFYKKRDFLRFLRYDEDGNLKHYHHRRVVFGVSCSSFLLGSTNRYYLERKLDEAKQGNEKYSRDIIRQLMVSFYVDNCLTSVKTESDLKQFIEVAIEIMAERKFVLRGWECTNPSESTASSTNALGMMWEIHCYTLPINIPDVK